MHTTRRGKSTVRLHCPTHESTCAGGCSRQPVRRRGAQRHRQVQPRQGLARTRFETDRLGLAHDPRAARAGAGWAGVLVRRRVRVSHDDRGRRVLRMGTGARQAVRHLACRCRGESRARPRRRPRNRLAGRAADQAALCAGGAGLHPAAELGRVAPASSAPRRGRARVDRPAPGERPRGGGAGEQVRLRYNQRFVRDGAFRPKTIVHSQRLRYAAQRRSRSQVFAALGLG